MARGRERFGFESLSSLALFEELAVTLLNSLHVADECVYP